MKTSWLLSIVELAFLAHKANSTDYPLLPYDPKTTSGCADWFNNKNGESYEWVRDYFRITPEEFRPLHRPPGPDMGCYVENPDMPIFDINIDPNGDPSLTIPKCWQTCYRRFYEYAGVQNGSQCWCGSCIGGEWAANQTDCNSPCTGNHSTFCGGRGLLQIFKAEENVPSATTPITSTTGTTSPNSTTGTARRLHEEKVESHMDEFLG
ncbi:hypothetical protein P885DRAFT_71429 [Corynascus similis CBS 632.67]